MKFTVSEIDQFIQGNLPKEKYDMFIKAIQNDSEFAKEVEFYKKVNSSSKKIGREELRTELDAIHKNKIENKDKESKSILNKVWPWLLALAILISIIVYWSIKNSEVSISSPELYANYYKPYEFNSGTRTNVEQKELLQLDELYASQNYETVIPLMEKYLVDNIESNNVQLALANAYLQTGKHNEALTSLESLEARNDVFLNGHVLWYKALCHLKLKDNRSCLTTLQQISADPRLDYHKEALELIREIKLKNLD